MNSVSRAWLIDASIYIFRAWFSLPDRWHTDDGMPVSAVYGYTKFLLDFLDSTGTPLHCAAAFDESLGSNYRNDIYPDYKASRELPDETLAFQLQACRDVTELLGVACFGGPRYEADDYIATLARLYRLGGNAVTVVTRDKDLGQIIHNEQDNWWDFAQGELIDAAAFVQRFGVRPDQFADYLALVGDAVDDIPGVPGVGPKTAARLLQELDTLDTLGSDFARVARLDIRGAAGVATRLEDHWQQVTMARQLTALESAVPGVKVPPGFSVQADNVAALIAYLEALNLGGALTRRCEMLAAECPA